jgi:uncharacterized protein (DUF488 family)
MECYVPRVAKATILQQFPAMRPISTILTLGYQQRSIGEYIELLRARGVGVLVDVRQTAWSHKPGFSKSGLKHALVGAGIQYVHAKMVGNPKSIRRQAHDHADCIRQFELYLESSPLLEAEFDLMIRQCLVREQRICLMCYERHPEDCHRSVIARRWAARHGAQVLHLEAGGCPRLIEPRIGRPELVASDTRGR